MSKLIDENAPKDVNDNELEFNKKHREETEDLMAKSSTNLDGYWDRNNPFVKHILFLLAVVIVGGVIYYVLAYMNSH